MNKLFLIASIALPLCAAQPPKAPTTYDVLPSAQTEPLKAYRFASITRGHMATIRYLESQHSSLITPKVRDESLRYAILNECDEVVAHQLHRKTDVNSSDSMEGTPLQNACWTGKENIVKWLRIFGADPDLGGTIDHRKEKLETAYDTVERILRTNYHFTPLTVERRANFERIKALLEQPASDFANRKNEVPFN